MLMQLLRASRLGLRATGGSDAHATETVPAAATRLEGFINAELVAVLSNGEYAPARLENGEGGAPNGASK